MDARCQRDIHRDLEHRWSLLIRSVLITQNPYYHSTLSNIAVSYSKMARSLTIITSTTLLLASLAAASKGTVNTLVFRIQQRARSGRLTAHSPDMSAPGAPILSRTSSVHAEATAISLSPTAASSTVSGALVVSHV